MSFSDEDLKKLRDYLGNQNDPNNHIFSSTSGFVIRLVARLEVAEKLCNYLNGFDDVNNPIVNELLKAWRKECGK